MEPVERVRELLRNRLIDPNTTRATGMVNWIFDDFPREDLSSSSFPRISVIELGEPAKAFGIGDTSQYAIYSMQIDVWVKSDTVYDVNNSYEGLGAARDLARNVLGALRLYWITDMTPEFLIYRSNKKTPVFQEDRNLWRITIDIEFEGVIKNDTYP